MSEVIANGAAANALARAIYELGHSTIFAARTDPRFAYCMYVPPHLDTATRPMELVVIVHGTGRSFVEYRDAFAEFARWNDCIVLCPLFPVGVRGDGNRDGFKHLAEGEIRYDQVLLDIVAEVGEKFSLDFSRFALFGYSGGGQFVNRFALLHPERLWAASIGAPGSVTLLDTEQNWWVGVRDIKERFGRELDLDALRKLAVHMVVGKADLETWEITHKEGGKFYMPGANDAGRTRPERLQTLKRTFEAAGVRVKFDLIDNVPHDGLKCVGQVQDFLAEALREKRADKS
ncbi:hydrolase [Bordetella avium]|uniref:Poly(Aspartic acid) hydrolase n=1 Tax=Bordetella avium (strain 197N) TaxID=360910 RepID=Q2KWT5_BORA1|nr:hydrolase [Bordetella avium]AZY49960.1 hydrolase [Bordetella avium]AZY53327.1 hydrolase [Bordetella avium]RIQ13081.1 alpha/beta hydrolase [Bordetella avium]RIQ17317.1 alpha/beta hydrolase [Bordetella avium]RIQ33802.1 alpha/beta hydrolase [Bordetella avium]